MRIRRVSWRVSIEAEPKMCLTRSVAYPQRRRLRAASRKDTRTASAVCRAISLLEHPTPSGRLAISSLLFADARAVWPRETNDQSGQDLSTRDTEQAHGYEAPNRLHSSEAGCDVRGMESLALEGSKSSPFGRYYKATTREWI